MGKNSLKSNIYENLLDARKKKFKEEDIVIIFYFTNKFCQINGREPTFYKIPYCKIKDGLKEDYLYINDSGGKYWTISYKEPDSFEIYLKGSKYPFKHSSCSLDQMEKWAREQGILPVNPIQTPVPSPLPVPVEQVIPYGEQYFSEVAEYKEGATNQVFIDIHERNPDARKACLEVHGYSCSVCGFDFEKVYGGIGKGFIHIHHLKPISKFKEEHKIDYKEDLRPVCPNCHAMLHSSDPPLTPEALKEIVKKQNNQ
jgi:hypothetical protein